MQSTRATALAAVAAAALIALAGAPAAAESTSLGEDFSRYSSESWLRRAPVVAVTAPAPAAPSTAANQPRVQRMPFQHGGSTTVRPEGGGPRR